MALLSMTSKIAIMAMTEMALACQIGVRIIIKITAQAMIIAGNITKSALLYPFIVLSTRVNSFAMKIAESAWKASGKL